MRCCIAECKSPFKNGIRSHCIPALPGLRKRWLEAVKMLNPGPNDRICSKHFTVNDYQENRTDTARPSLFQDAIPSRNLPTLVTNRGFDQEIKTPQKVQTTRSDNLLFYDEGYQLHFEDDVGEDERRFYLKLFPLVNLVRDKKTHCTSCNIHLGTAPANEYNVKMHPILKVSQCKKCHDFYNSGEFSKGEDGSELYCRWCGQGGEVYCCAKCPYVFCKACIGGNLAKSLVADIRDNENWSCFVCSPKITWPIRAVHWALKNYIGKQKQSILLSNSNETEIRRLMKKDTSSCCRGKLDTSDDSSNDSDIPLKKTYATPPLAKKRKISTEEILGQPKPKILNSILTGPNVSSGSTSGINSTSLKKSGSVSLAPKNQTVMLNSGLVIQKHPLSSSSSSTSNSGTAVIRPIQHNQTQVKIVQLTNQHNKTVNVPLNVTHSTLQSAPPPLLIRNRGVQIRQHPVNVPNRSILRSTPASASATSTTGGPTNTDHTPVYHTIGGFCIDLNSAAQHDSIRLPNGKLIQVKKSSNNTNQTTVGQRSQIPSGVLHQQPTQPQQHFTITQPITTQQTGNVQQTSNIQTIPASAIIPNGNGSLQIINANVIQQIQNQQQQSNQSTIRTNGPILIRSSFPNTPVGKARNQLQNQIFTAMEICQHLSGKIQTLTNSNPYKNANNHIDVKELYIHLSYLFTYAIGRFKNLQDKCNEDMTSMGFNTDVSKLTKGQLAAEKYASDGDEDEIEIVEPKTTTIDLDSDNEDSIQSNRKSNDAKLTNNINTLQLKELQKQQVSKQQQMLRDKQNQQTYKLQEFQEQHKMNLQHSDDNEYDLPLTLLAGMLEVELTEGNDSLNSTSSGSTLPKKPRKKTTNKPNPHLIKQQREQLRAKYDEIKRCDVKLKQNCSIIIDPLDLDVNNVKKALQRYSEQQNDNDIRHFEMMREINDNDDLHNSGNLDDSSVAILELLEVTMDGGEELHGTKNIITNVMTESDKLMNTINQNISDDEDVVKKDTDENITKENCENNEDDMKKNSDENITKENSENNPQNLNDDDENNKNETANIEELISDKIKEIDEPDKELNSENILEFNKQNAISVDTEIPQRDNATEKIETDNSKRTETNFEDNEISKNCFELENANETMSDVLNENNKLDVTELSEKVKLDDEISINNAETEGVNENKAANTTNETSESNDIILDNCNSIYKDDNKEGRSNIELIESSDDSISHTENMNVVDHNISLENHSLVNNGNRNSANKDSTDIAEEPELKSNKENESNINKTTDNATIEPMDIDSNLLNIENSCDLIDELLADAAKSKSSGDDDCTNDILDHQLSDSLLTGE